MSAQSSYEKAIPATTFSIEPVIRSGQLAQGGSSALLAVNATIGALGDAELLLMKMNGLGEATQSLVLGDAGGQGYHDVGMEAVQVGSDYFVCGYTRGIDTASPPTFSSFLVKVDSSLQLQWQMNYILPGQEIYANAMTANAGGSFLIAGQIYDGSDFHTMLMKTDQDGNVLWLKKYDMPLGERVHCVRQLPGGDILLSGNVVFGFELVLPFICKVNASGDFLWGKYYNYPPSSPVEHSNFLFMHVQGVDDILLCGHTDVLGVGGEDFYIVDIDSAGTVNWARTYGASQFEFPTAAVFDAPANELVMLGNSSSYGASFTPTSLAMRIAPGGLLIGAFLYGDTSGTQMTNLTATQRIGFDNRLLMGWRSFPADDIYLAGTDNDLANVCNAYPISPAVPGQTTGTGPFDAVASDPAYITNDLSFAATSFTGGTFLCDPPTGMTEDRSGDVVLLPNPSDGDARLICPEPLTTADRVEIIDAHGRVLRSRPGTGTRELLIERNGLASGMYAVRVRTSSGLMTQPWILR